MPAAKLKRRKRMYICIKVVDLWNPKKHLNRPRAFPVTAQSKARYVMVMVTIDVNAILLCPIKNRSDQELTVTYRTLVGRAKATGLEVKNMFWIMSVPVQ